MTILCVTLNPCLDKTLTVDPWKPGDSVRGEHGSAERLVERGGAGGERVTSDPAIRRGVRRGKQRIALGQWKVIRVVRPGARTCRGASPKQNLHAARASSADQRPPRQG